MAKRGTPLPGYTSSYNKSAAHNFGKTWSATQIQGLKFDFVLGLSLKELAIKYGRDIGGIVNMLNKQDLITSGVGFTFSDYVYNVDTGADAGPNPSVIHLDANPAPLTADELKVFITPAYPTQPETITVTAPNIETKTFINGVDAANLTDEEIFSRILKIENQIKGYDVIAHRHRREGRRGRVRQPTLRPVHVGRSRDRRPGEMVMKKIQVSEATNIQLDWLVWNCAGGAAAYPKTASGKAFSKLWHGNSAKYLHPSTDWAQGGPIIEREKIDVAWCADGWYANMYWRGLDVIPAAAAGESFRCGGDGNTPLIAAARCFVTSKLGETVEVPEELA